MACVVYTGEEKIGGLFVSSKMADLAHVKIALIHGGSSNIAQMTCKNQGVTEKGPVTMVAIKE